MEKITVIIVILVICFVIYYLCVGKKGEKMPSPVEEKKSEPVAPIKNEPEEVFTRLVSKLTIQQLDRSGRVVKEFSKNRIPPEGITVSRPGAKLGDIILSEASGEDAMTVGTEGIVIAEDEKGMFGKIFDNGREKNKLYLYDPVTAKSREVTQFDIANNTMICIGSQWLRFIIPTVPGAPTSPMDFNRKTARPIAESLSQQSGSQPGESPTFVASSHSAPKGFSFESSVDENGRFVIKRN